MAKKPSMISKVDMKFKYTSSNSTDIRKTFAIARKKIAEEAEKKLQDEQERIEKVRSIAK